MQARQSSMAVFIAAAYTMYNQDPANLTPQPSTDLPEGCKLTAWVQMQDFILDSTDPVFYGFIAVRDENPNQAVLAIRGTSNGVEWWDDSNSLGLTAFKVPGYGNVGLGFARIYDTLEIVEHPPAAAAMAPNSLKQVGSFSAQVAAHLTRRARAAVSPQAVAPAPTVDEPRDVGLPMNVEAYSYGVALLDALSAWRFFSLRHAPRRAGPARVPRHTRG